MKEGIEIKDDNLRKYMYMGCVAFLTISSSIVFFFIFFKYDIVKEHFVTIRRILMPFVYGAGIAYLLTPVCNWIDNQFKKWFEISKMPKQRAKKYQRFFGKISVFSSLIMLCVFIYALFVMVIPQVLESIMILADETPSYIVNATEWLEKLFADNQFLVNYLEQYREEMTNGIQTFVKTNLIPNMNNIISGLSTSLISTVKVAINLLIGIIISVYLMSSRSIFKLQAKKIIRALFRTEISDKIITELQVANKYCSGFIKGKLLDSLIIGIICMVVLGFLKMPYSVLISVIIGVTNFVPFFGPFIGAVPSTFLIFMVSPIQSVYFIIFILILQQFDGNILGPKILGDATNLSSFWTLFAIIFFGGLMGIPGMIIGVPVFAFIHHLIKEWVNYKYNKRYPETLKEEQSVSSQ